MGNLNCFPNEDQAMGVGVERSTADTLGSSLEKSERDAADLDQVTNLVQNLKKKQMEHQNVLALCQELHMSNEQLKEKLKNTEHTLHEREAKLDDNSKKMQVHQTDAEVYKTQLEEATAKLKQMEILQKQLDDIRKERNELTERNRRLEQQVVEAITIQAPSKAPSTVGTTEEENQTEEAITESATTSEVRETDSEKKVKLGESKRDPAGFVGEAAEKRDEEIVEAKGDPTQMAQAARPNEAEPATKEGRQRLDTLDNLTIYGDDDNQTPTGETSGDAGDTAGETTEDDGEPKELERNPSLESHHKHLEEHLDEFGLD